MQARHRAGCFSKTLSLALVSLSLYLPALELHRMPSPALGALLLCLIARGRYTAMAKDGKKIEQLSRRAPLQIRTKTFS